MPRRCMPRKPVRAPCQAMARQYTLRCLSTKQRMGASTAPRYCMLVDAEAERLMRMQSGGCRAAHADAEYQGPSQERFPLTGHRSNGARTGYRSYGASAPVRRW
eukprot:339199-Chlamydomonas_euryale.AAC.1